VSVLARVFEEAGLTTVSLVLVREHAEKVKPPRALFIPFPYGYPLGKPDDPEFQHRVLGAAFDLLGCEEGPVLVDFPDETGTPDLPQASMVETSTDPIMEDPANEVTALRPFYERWVESKNGRTSVVPSGIHQRRFRGMIRFLESYARGEEADIESRPSDISVDRYIRYCVDDLKAFTYEARMGQSPASTETELHTWFWGKTAAGRLVSDLAQRMKDSGDSGLESMANGLAR
jgi:hypothetical protein